jgi:pSer/pThr/pTyr-binding forkhead associated (FHA) protein
MPAVYLTSLATPQPGLSLPVAVAIDCFPCVVGRHPDCDRRLDDRSVSRRQCAFSLREGRVWLEDLGSLNGTALNGRPLDSATPLAQDDRLELGHLHFAVQLAEGPMDEPVDLGAAARGSDDPTHRKLA